MERVQPHAFIHMMYKSPKKGGGGGLLTRGADADVVDAPVLAADAVHEVAHGTSQWTQREAALLPPRWQRHRDLGQTLLVHHRHLCETQGTRRQPGGAAGMAPISGWPLKAARISSHGTKPRKSFRAVVD